MELKEYIRIIKIYKTLFVGTILLVILGAFAYFIFRPESWSASLTLDITRSGSQETPDYKYDDFYRLQADEKFVETVVEWLKSPRIAADIYERAEVDAKNLSIRHLKNSIGAEKRSSQVVAVSFSAPKKEISQRISNAVVKTISENTQALNEKQDEKTWFEIVAREPVIAKDSYDFWLVFAVSLAGGIFLGFWVVMIRHYLK